MEICVELAFITLSRLYQILCNIANFLPKVREEKRQRGEREKPIVFPEFILVRMKVGAGAAAISIEVAGCGSRSSSFLSPQTTQLVSHFLFYTGWVSSGFSKQSWIIYAVVGKMSLRVGLRIGSNPVIKELHPVCTHKKGGRGTRASRHRLFVFLFPLMGAGVSLQKRRNAQFTPLLTLGARKSEPPD